jgi:hypothetical protein
MDASGHYSHPEVLSLRIDHTPKAPVHKENHEHEPAGDKRDSAIDFSIRVTPSSWC